MEYCAPAPLHAVMCWVGGMVNLWFVVGLDTLHGFCGAPCLCPAVESFIFCSGVDGGFGEGVGEGISFPSLEVVWIKSMLQLIGRRDKK